ncbi:MAG: type III-B CRISPR module RAMP protein Cmr1 [Methylobacter sp.]
MKTLEADFKIVTPMFMSGADQGIAELRPPSIKAVIRFWWRALAYSRFNGDLAALANLEKELFGSTERAASIIIRISSRSRTVATPKNAVHQSFKVLSGARYLGYGLMDAFDGRNTEAGKLQRPCINHNQRLIVNFISKSDIPQEFVDAIKLTGLLGGLGSRSRKGFGSLTLDKLTLDKESIWTKPQDTKAYKSSLSVLLNGIDSITEEPPFSAFSKLTRIDCLQQGTDPIRLLHVFGQQMQRYRSWGKDNRVNGEESEQNFQADHHWYRRLGDYRNSDFHPRRVVFGLPHNYSQNPSDNVTSTEHDRRAGPLLVHVHEYGPERYALISIVLRAKFLPDKEKIKAGNKWVPQHIEWDVIDKFLDGYVGHRCNKTSELYFPNKDIWFGGLSNGQ